MNLPDPPPSLLVHGAGAIGLYLGGRLALAGVPVHFIGRARIIDALNERGLHVEGLNGETVHLQAGWFTASTSLADANSPSLVLLTVKGTATATAANELNEALPAGTPVLSFQNGVDNAARIRTAAPGLQTIAGMVPFNVLQPEPTIVRQATGGHLTAEDTPVTRAWQSYFATAGLPLMLAPDMRAVMWGKLLLNLNNPLNALAGIPLAEQLADRAFRCLLARLQDEALAAMHAEGIVPARVIPLPSRWLPTLLRLPTPLFRLLARRMLTIQPDARLSMYFDRIRGRHTEVDDLCGAVVRLAGRHDVAAPANRAVQQLVENAAADQFFSATQIAAAIGAALESR